ncbi:MAG: aldo/keto reductase [Planctomycetota bacterium]|nr:aldo/keto reductase [Planctomycetota bacterium]
MKYGKVEGIQPQVSRAGLGSMVFGTDPAALANTFALIDAFLEAGGNLIDTAHGYGGGKSEEAIGLYLEKRGNRDKLLIETKGCHPYSPEPRVTPQAIASDVSDSLRRMKTSYLDLWLFHRDDPKVAVGPLVDELNAHIAAGRIRAIGASNWSTQRIDEFNEYAHKKGLKGFVVNSPHLSLAAAKEAMWGGCTIADEAAKNWHRNNRMPLFAWSSQARGFFSGRFAPDKLDGDKDVIRVYYSPENFERLRRATELGAKKGLTAIQIAAAYVMSQNFPTWCLIGPANVDELKVSVAALDLELSPEECRWLNLEA